MELQGATPPRPLTHDLLKTIIGELGGKVESIVISDLIDDIYHARIILDANGRHVEVDSRSSDAIALATRHTLEYNTHAECLVGLSSSSAHDGGYLDGGDVG